MIPAKCTFRLDSRIVFLRNEPPVPGKKRLRGDNIDNLLPSPEPETFGFSRKTPNGLADRQLNAVVYFTSLLLLQHLDLFLEEVDHVLLLAIHPACQTNDHQSHHVHQRNLATSNS